MNNLLFMEIEMLFILWLIGIEVWGLFWLLRRVMVEEFYFVYVYIWWLFVIDVVRVCIGIFFFFWIFFNEEVGKLKDVCILMFIFCK